jgi:hypothetical protein
LFVVYCNGPHCNGADKAAKKMIGGVEGWKAEGFDLTKDEGSARNRDKAADTTTSL